MSTATQAQQLSRGLTILSLLRDRGPFTSEELAQEVGISHRQVNRMLVALRAAGIVEQEPERRGIALYHRAAESPSGVRRGTRRRHAVR